MLDTTVKLNTPPLTEQELDSIAEKVTERILQMGYEEIGRSVTKKFLWLLGVVTVGVGAYLSAKGFIHQ